MNDRSAYNLDRVAYSIADACRLLSIGKTTLYKEIGAGNLRLLKPGTKKSLILAKDIAGYLDKLASASVQQAD